MTEILWPFETEGLVNDCEHDANCTLNRVLPTRLNEVCAENEFLYDYLHWLPMSDIGVPGFYPKLTRSMRDLDDKNIIYPIKDGLFVHIYPNPTGARDHYVPIEPHMTYSLDELVAKIEVRLIDWSEEIGGAETLEEKGAVIGGALDEIMVVVARGDTWREDDSTEDQPTSRRRENSSRRNGNRNGSGKRGRDQAQAKIRVTQREYDAIKYLILRDKVGLGPIAPLLLDPYIEDISCSGLGPIFLEHKIFESIQSTISFPTAEDVDQFVVWMGEWIKRPVTVRNPIVDSVLPDGSRINIVYGTDISKRGSNFTIRKFNDTPLSVFELIEFGTMDYMMAAYLSFVLEEDLNMFVVGATASGKTTTLNAITTFILPNAKIVTIEDTPELQVPHPNWIREMTRGGGREKTGSEVDMFDLLKAALRQRPNRIIVGEIRGEEGAIAFQAMQTGHGVMSTFHAASVEKLIQRLNGEPINIPKAYIDNLQVVLIQSAVKTPSGMARRVTSISEIVGYDSLAQSFSVIESFRWNPATDTFEFPGYMNSFILEEVIASKKGIPPHKRRVIYTDLKRRAKIFERLHLGRKVKNFHDVFEILSEAFKQNLL